MRSLVITAIGTLNKLTLLVAVAVHPFMSVPVTVYVVGTCGDTFIDAVVAPVFQR